MGIFLCSPLWAFLHRLVGVNLLIYFKWSDMRYFQQWHYQADQHLQSWGELLAPGAGEVGVPAGGRGARHLLQPVQLHQAGQLLGDQGQGGNHPKCPIFGKFRRKLLRSWSVCLNFFSKLYYIKYTDRRRSQIPSSRAPVGARKLGEK